MKRSSWIGAGLIGALMVGSWLWFERRPTITATGEVPQAVKSGAAVSDDSRRSDLANNRKDTSTPNLSPRRDAPTPEFSPLTAGLNAPSGDITADLLLVAGIFESFRTNFLSTGNPVGENAEITAVLTGVNTKAMALISPNHPAINARGELCDRWGTPFFFHQLSGAEMEIRSAGPDRQFHTPDDSLLTP